DLRRFERRHSLLWGLNGKGRVVRGMPHVDATLASQIWMRGFENADFDACDRRMLSAVGDRDRDRDRWGIGEPYSNFTFQTTRLDAPDLKVRTVYHLQDSLLHLVRQFVPAVLSCLLYLAVQGLSV